MSAKRLDRFWRHLEHSSLGAMRKLWQGALGPDFEMIEPYLRPTDRRSSVYPCSNPVGSSCLRKVVEFSEDDIMAYCPDEEDPYCDPVPVTAEELVIWDLDLRKLIQSVARALGFVALPRLREVNRRTWQVGEAVMPVHREPVFLYLPSFNVREDRMALDLLAETRQRFILLSSRGIRDSATMRLLEQRSAEVLILPDLLEVGSRGEMTSLVSIANLSSDEPHCDPPVEAEFVFRQLGEYWEVCFAGKAVQLKDSKGLVYLEILLKNPDREFSAMALSLAAGESLPLASSLLDVGEVLSVDGETQEPALDRQAVQELGHRIQEIESELENSESHQDLGRSDRLRLEKEQIESHLARSLGKQGSGRREGVQTKRIRDRVMGALRRSLDSLNRQHPAFGQHLVGNLHSGSEWSYRPETQVPWSFGD